MLKYNQYKNFYNQQQKTAAKSWIFLNYDSPWLHPQQGKIYLNLGVTPPKN